MKEENTEIKYIFQPYEAHCNRSQCGNQAWNFLHNIFPLFLLIRIVQFGFYVNNIKMIELKVHWKLSCHSENALNSNRIDGMAWIRFSISILERATEREREREAGEEWKSESQTKSMNFLCLNKIIATKLIYFTSVMLHLSGVMVMAIVILLCSQLKLLTILILKRPFQCTKMIINELNVVVSLRFTGKCLLADWVGKRAQVSGIISFVKLFSCPIHLFAIIDRAKIQSISYKILALFNRNNNRSNWLHAVHKQSQRKNRKKNIMKIVLQ